jgi:NAD+ diphosphatase
MGREFESLVEPPGHVANRPGLWFMVGRATVLMEMTENGLKVPELRHPSEIGINVQHEQFLGLLDGDPVWVGGVEGDTPEGVLTHRHENLFTLFAHLDETTWALAGRAVQIAEWQRTHRYCGRCGDRTEAAPGERATRCPSCGLLNFPRLSPAVITVVERGDEVLLARGRTFGPNPMYSALAGFVEPGESLEQAVAREIKEEVGVEVTNIRYFGSQPWPFPHSLMVGFHADWAGGDIHIDETEIVDAQWWRANAMPNMPGGLSIARWLIDDWLKRQG